MKLEFSLTVRSNAASGAAAEISLLLRKVEQPLERLGKRELSSVDSSGEKKREREREREREDWLRRQRDRAPDMARYNENMAAT